MLTMKAVLAGDAALKQVEEVRKQWKKGLLEERNAIWRYYRATVETWREHHPRFKSKYGENQDMMWVDTWTENRIYWFVHEGISVMHAVLSSDWSPKTRPGILRSGPGSGRLVRVRPEYEGPLYEPREFTEEIIERRQKPFQRRMEYLTAVGVRKSQGG